MVLSCYGNALKELDLSNIESIYTDKINADGWGTIGFDNILIYDEDNDWYEPDETLFAVPAEGCEFIGWYNEDGELLSSEAEYRPGYTDKVFIAKFTSGLPGDINSDGSVNANDALTVLRFALGSITDINNAAADVNGDGIVNANDALMVLRAALGLITL